MTCWQPVPMFDRYWLTHGAMLVSIRLDQCASVLQRCIDTLSPEEHARVIRFRRPERRESFAIGRATLRTILGWFLNTPPQQVGISNDFASKPRHRGEANQPVVNFNVSHSGNLVIIGLTTL